MTNWRSVGGVARGSRAGGRLVLLSSLAIAGCGGSTEADDGPKDASAGGDAGADGGGGDGTPDVATDGGSDGSVADCALPPGDRTSCASDDDCAMVSSGCYCGPQPVYGVSKGFVDAVAACEAVAAANCMLGCMNEPWRVAEDGQEDGEGGTIKVRCTPVDGGPKACNTYLE